MWIADLECMLHVQCTCKSFLIIQYKRESEEAACGKNGRTWIQLGTGTLLQESCLSHCVSFAKALRIMFTLTYKGHLQIWHCVNAKLTLGQCQRRRNCVKLYIIRLVLMGQRCLNYFVVTLDQKTITTNQNEFRTKKIFVIYGEK